MNGFDFTFSRRLGARILLAVVLGGVAPVSSWAANTNPSVTFQPGTTNTNLTGKYFSFQIYTVSKYTNQLNILVSSTNLSTNQVRKTFSNSLVFLGANFTNPVASQGLGSTNGLKGLYFDPTNGILYGIPTNNFILLISNGGIQMVSTNRTWTVTNTYSNNILISNNPSSTNNQVYTNLVTTNPAYRFIFQTNPVMSFTNTNMATGATNVLPPTNANGLNYTYTNLSGPGYVTNSNNLVATGPGTLLVRVAIDPGTNVIWAPLTNNYFVTVTNPTVSGFAFVTNTNASNYTRTNLTYLASTPLVLTNQGVARVSFSLDRPTAGLFTFSNGLTYLQALGGTGNLVVTATRAATASNSASTAVLTNVLSLAVNPLTLGGVFATTNSITITNPAMTALVLSGSASNGTVVFSTTDTNTAQITNGTTLRLLANGTSSVVASVINANPNNYLATDPITNTVVVNWPSPATPVFTSTNRQDGTVGTSFSYTLVATATNTSAFPVTYAATNLPQGMVFTNSNQITGTPTLPGLYRIQLTASNGGGVSTLILTSAIAPSPALAATNFWTNLVAMGSGTNTNGAYTILGGLPSGVGSLTTNLSGFIQPVLMLTNNNTNPTSPGWFAGVSNLSVVFSNSQTNVTSSITLNVQPVTPGLSIPSSVAGTPGTLLSITGSISPSVLTNIPGYPLSFRATNLPEGVFLNPASGVISGKATFAGQTTASVWASNAIGASSTSQVTFDIQALAGAPMQMSVAFTNALGTYAVPNLPPGLYLSPTSGVVTGNPQAVGTFDLTVNFVRSGTAITNTTGRSLTILPPAPIPRVPTNLVTARTGQPFHFQPWVSGAGWGWAGADPLMGTTISTNWTNQLLVGTSSVVLSTNGSGGILPTTNGLTFRNNTNYNELYLLWRSNLPSSWPWQAILRLRIPGNLTNSNGFAYPVLGAIRARSPSYPTNYLDEYADGGLYAESTNGVTPWSLFYSPNSTNFPSGALASVGTNEVAIRFSFETNTQTLVIAANTNLATNVFVGLTTNTNLVSEWSLTNAAAAFQLALGSSFSNQAVSSGEILLRNFVVLPRGIGFYATNLPPELRCDPETGTIYGTPTNTFSGLIYLYATNSQGTNFTGFRLRVIP